MIEKITESLEIIYAFVPQEIFIVMLAGIVFLIFEWMKKGPSNN